MIENSLAHIASKGGGIRVERIDRSVVIGTLVDWCQTSDGQPIWVAVDAAGAKRMFPWSSIVEITIP